jgi:hypothetical protein
VLADLDLEVHFLVETHAAGSGTALRTSIWPVTAAEMRAERRSRSRVIADVASMSSSPLKKGR